MPDMPSICRDLWGEHDALDQIVAALPDADWDKPTPAEGWTVRDQISHLHYFDDRALLAVTDPDAFKAWRDTEANACGDCRARYAPVRRGQRAPRRCPMVAWRCNVH